MVARAIGVDLGTTFSAAAYVDDRGVPRVIPNADGKQTTPSVVLVQEGRIAVGEMAMNQWVTNEEHVVRWIKRAIGDSQFRFQELSAVEISAEILKAIKADAELHLGESVEEAVITCPAYFNTLEVENTKRAGELAGFRVREVVKEPTAAAVYYGVEHMRDGEKILVCDLGGGTYDATVLALEKGSFRPLASMGGRDLGGHDWTMELVGLVAEQFLDKHGQDPRNDLVAAQALYEECERAKRDFARRPETTISCRAHGIIDQVTISQEDFEIRNEGRIQQLVTWSEQALEKANLKWPAIDTILLVGGSSRLRRVSEALEEASSRRPVSVNTPDLAVALGAAILAHGSVFVRRSAGGLTEVPVGGGLVEVDYHRIISRNLGTRVIDSSGQQPQIVNALIISHSTEAPVEAHDDFEVAYNGQEHFDVPVVEFEDEDDFDTIRNYRCRCRAGAAKGDQIRVTFHYDASGIVTATAVDLSTGEALPTEERDYEEPDLKEVRAFGPRWVVFALDISYSMKGEKLNNAKRALSDSARDLLAVGGEDWRVGIVTFGSYASDCCAPTADLRTFQSAVDSVSLSGTTAMDEGILRSLAMVSQAPSTADRDIVMVTDGMPDDDRISSTLDAAKRVEDSGVSLCILGIGSRNVDENFLAKMTPLKLVIEKSEGMGGKLANLLARSAKSRAGKLREI